MLVATIMSCFFAMLTLWWPGQKILADHWYAIVATVLGLWLGVLAKLFLVRFVSFPGDDNVYALVGALVLGGLVENVAGKPAGGSSHS